MASKTQRNLARESLLFLAVIGGILILLNVLSAYFSPPRIDLTQNNLFSLADGSKNVAKNLDDRLEVKAYFTKDLPPPFNATERQVRDLLQEYAAASDGKITVKFINPDDEEGAEAARSDGIQRVAHQNIEEDQVSVIEGYRGLVLKYLGEKKTIPVIQNTQGLEYTLTTAIKELAGDKATIGLVKASEGPSLTEGLTRLQEILPTYEVKEINANEEIDTELAAVLVIGAEGAFSEAELQHLNQFVVRGGSLGVFGGAFKVDLQGPNASAATTGLNDLLKPWGAELADKMIADWQCGRAPMRGPMGMQVLVPYPAIPVVQLTEAQQEHPVMYRLASPMMPFTGAVTTGDAPSDVTVTTLAESSKNSWAISDATIQLAPKQPQDWVMSNDLGPFPLVVAIEGKLPSAFGAVSSESGQDIVAPAQASESVRVLVAGSSSFIRDEFMPPKNPNQPLQMSAGMSLALNAIDWLAADSDLMAIRAKTIEEPALDIPEAVVSAENEARAAAEGGDEQGVLSALEQRKGAIASWDEKKLMYRWLNTLGIPVLFALYGLFRWRRRLNLKRTLKL